MSAPLTRHLPVARCIGCGARSFSAECPDGCSDEPLDLVDVEDLVAVASRAEALEERVAELRELARTVASGSAEWPAARDRARAALRPAVPAEPEIELIEGWGCPECGRVDAPRPCLGICLRKPGLVADVREAREYAAAADRAAALDAPLSELARLLAGITPRPGREAQTMASLRARARALLERLGG